MDRKVVEDFGKEWSRFDQTELSPSEYDKMFSQYFSVFPWDLLSAEAAGVDVGCGSGRWARLVAPKVGRLICLDPSGQRFALLYAQWPRGPMSSSASVLPMPCHFRRRRWTLRTRLASCTTLGTSKRASRR